VYRLLKVEPYFEMILLEKVRTAIAGYMTCSCFPMFEIVAACWKRPTTRKKCTKREQGVGKGRPEVKCYIIVAWRSQGVTREVTQLPPHC
jgi:hypothetical protein